MIATAIMTHEMHATHVTVCIDPAVALATLYDEIEISGMTETSTGGTAMTADLTAIEGTMSQDDTTLTLDLRA